MSIPGMGKRKINLSQIKDEMTKISRIVILNQEDPAVEFLLELKIVSNSEYKELPTQILSEKFGFAIKKAYVLRSKKG